MILKTIYIGDYIFIGCYQENINADYLNALCKYLGLLTGLHCFQDSLQQCKTLVRRLPFQNAKTLALVDSIEEVAKAGKF